MGGRNEKGPPERPLPSSAPWRVRSLVDLEQARAALAAADAHGDDAVFHVPAPAALLQDMAGAARAGHAERVADGDRAAVDVVLLRIDAEGVAGVEALGGERLVQLPQVD